MWGFPGKKFSASFFPPALAFEIYFDKNTAVTHPYIFCVQFYWRRRIRHLVKNRLRFQSIIATSFTQHANIHPLKITTPTSEWCHDQRSQSSNKNDQRRTKMNRNGHIK
jgi:hypothetical protein